jgi:hypothetical protein
VNRRGTMNKLKMLVVAALAAATVGVGALAAAPSASAMPFHDAICADLGEQLVHDGQMADDLAKVFGPDFWLVTYWNERASNDYGALKLLKC